MLSAEGAAAHQPGRSVAKPWVNRTPMNSQALKARSSGTLSARLEILVVFTWGDARRACPRLMSRRAVGAGSGPGSPHRNHKKNPKWACSIYPGSTHVQNIDDAIRAVIVR